MSRFVSLALLMALGSLGAQAQSSAMVTKLKRALVFVGNEEVSVTGLIIDADQGHVLTLSTIDQTALPLYIASNGKALESAIPQPIRRSGVRDFPNLMVLESPIKGRKLGSNAPTFELAPAPPPGSEAYLASVSPADGKATVEIKRVTIAAANHRIGEHQLVVYNSELRDHQHGGLLLTRQGNVIGTAVLEPADTEGLGFALPINPHEIGRLRFGTWTRPEFRYRDRLLEKVQPWRAPTPEQLVDEKARPELLKRAFHLLDEYRDDLYPAIRGNPKAADLHFLAGAIYARTWMVDPQRLKTFGSLAETYLKRSEALGVRDIPALHAYQGQLALVAGDKERAGKIWRGALKRYPLSAPYSALWLAASLKDGSPLSAAYYGQWGLDLLERACARDDDAAAKASLLYWRRHQASLFRALRPEDQDRVRLQLARLPTQKDKPADRADLDAMDFGGVFFPNMGGVLNGAKLPPLEPHPTPHALPAQLRLDRSAPIAAGAGRTIDVDGAKALGVANSAAGDRVFVRTDRPELVILDTIKQAIVERHPLPAPADAIIGLPKGIALFFKDQQRVLILDPKNLEPKRDYRIAAKQVEFLCGANNNQLLCVWRREKVEFGHTRQVPYLLNLANPQPHLIPTLHRRGVDDPHAPFPLDRGELWIFGDDQTWNTVTKQEGFRSQDETVLAPNFSTLVTRERLPVFKDDVMVFDGPTNMMVTRNFYDRHFAMRVAKMDSGAVSHTAVFELGTKQYWSDAGRHLDDTVFVPHTYSLVYAVENVLHVTRIGPGPVKAAENVPPARIRVGERLRYQATAPEKYVEFVYEIERGPPGMSIDPKTGKVDWQPTIAALGEYRVSIIVRGRYRIANGKERKGVERVYSWELEIVP